MAIILGISKHSPESCPMYDEKRKKMVVDLGKRIGELAGKHGIKVVGGWNVASEHLMLMVYDVPSLEAFAKFGMEPEMAAWGAFNDTQFKHAISMEEAIKMME